jgi:hypothetical protein
MVQSLMYLRIKSLRAISFWRLNLTLLFIARTIDGSGTQISACAVFSSDFRDSYSTYV